MDLLWLILLAVYLLAIAITAAPILVAYRQKIPNVKLVYDGKELDDISRSLSESALKDIRLDFKLMKGHQQFWKKQVDKAKSFHDYAVFWTTFNTFLIPILTLFLQPGAATTPSVYLTAFIFFVSVHSAGIVTFHRQYKPDDKLRDARQRESAYFDAYRQILQRPETLGATEAEQITAFLTKSAEIRAGNRQTEVLLSPVLDHEKANIPPTR